MHIQYYCHNPFTSCNSWTVVLWVMDGEMDTKLTTPAISTVTSSDDTTLLPPSSFILDVSLISAQDLAPVSKSMRTYAIAWIHPSKKLSTRVDQQSHNNPLWNDRFAFRVDMDFLSSDQAAVTVEIYTVAWFKDVLVGTVSVLISDLITPCTTNSTRYVALQIRRPSGNPQGMLNMGVALMSATDRNTPLYREMDPLINDYRHLLAKMMDNNSSLTAKVDDHVVNYEEPPDHQVTEKIHLWRSYSAGSNEFNDEFTHKSGPETGSGSMCNGSTVNGSELCSDVGPSASIVAAEIAKKLIPPLAEGPKTSRPNAKDDNFDDFGSSIVEEMTLEEATAKGLISNDGRLTKEVSLPTKRDGKYERSKSATGGKHSRRQSEGGLFSCFGNAYGFEITIVCGANNQDDKSKSNKNKSNSKRRIIGSESNSAP